MLIFLLLLAAAWAHAQNVQPLTPDAAGVFAIWPGKPPGSEAWNWREQTEMRNGNRMVRNVVTPTLTMYRPSEGKANGTSVIVAPGGAFRFLMVDYEGVDMARWFAERGVTAFVLKYRLMRTPEDEAAMTKYLAELTKSLTARNVRSDNPPPFDEATQAAIRLAEEDGRQAVRYVRSHAAEWGLDPHRVGIMGFSAGGAVTMGPVMEHDAASRPDFAAPIYPAYRTATPVPQDAPPLFIVIADDDRLVSPGSSARLYMAWHSAGKPAELHIFHRGEHGFGMKKQGRPTDQWTDLLHSWMQSSGLIRTSFDKPISRMYVFGDSYSDTGAGYLDGNGPTAVAYLANRLGFPLALPSSAGANHGSINFAVSGAQTGKGAGRKVKDALLGRGMLDQVDDFLARVQSRAISFDADRTLFFLAGGLNDRKLPSSETVANLKEQCRKLHRAGARRFRIALLPTEIPAFAEVGKRLNPELERMAKEVGQELSNSEVQLSRWGAFFDQVMKTPSAYGIENTKDACAGRSLFNEDATPCSRPQAYYYFHAGHPSTAVHKIVGEQLFREVRQAR